MVTENAQRDSNRNVVLLLLANDGSGEIQQARIDPSTYRLLVNSTITGSIDIDDISSGTQTNDIKITLDGENITIATLNQAVSGYSADITTTAQEIAFSDGDITIPENTKGIIIQNDDADNIIYIGGSTVTSAGANAAYALNNQGDSISFNNIGTSFSVYVVGSAAGTQLRITYM